MRCALWCQDPVERTPLPRQAFIRLERQQEGGYRPRGALVRPAAEALLQSPRRTILQDAEGCLLRLLARDQAEHAGEQRRTVTRQ